MGLFDKISKAFEKKNCEFCGSEIGLLGNRKLEDGNMCGKCAAKLSPFFDERRHSTVAQIQAQLNYREENKAAVERLNITRSIGAKGTRLLVDENAGKFVVVNNSSNWKESNPDVIDISAVTGCRIDVNETENKREIKRKDAEGKEVSFNPPRYEYSYSYNVYVLLDVRHDYFDDIKIHVNQSTITTKMRGTSEELYNCKGIAEDMKAALTRSSVKETVATETVYSQAQPVVNKGPVTCPYCGATDVPGADGHCIYCNGALY